MLGPLFHRELLTAPRQLRHYLMRAGYVGGLFVLLYTLAQVTFGWQQERSLGELARFGGLVFQVFSLVQLVLVLFFSLLFSAGNVAAEKDRKTLILLLMTDLRNHELVLGKLFASLLSVATLLLAAAPAFALLLFLGGVTPQQIAASLALSASTALAAGSWGTLIAYWREKTFQTLAWSVLGVVLFLGGTEAAIAAAGPRSPAGQAIALLNPFRGMLLILDPLAAEDSGFGIQDSGARYATAARPRQAARLPLQDSGQQSNAATTTNHQPPTTSHHASPNLQFAIRNSQFAMPSPIFHSPFSVFHFAFLSPPSSLIPHPSSLNFIAAQFLIAIVLSTFTIARLRRWNPSDALWTPPQTEEDAGHKVRVKHRAVWNNPIIWREICTGAYGKKIFVIKLAYLVMFAAAIAYVARGDTSELILGMVSPSGFAFIGLAIISLMLVNAQAVTALTTERDARTLELLLVTDVTAKEFIFGKLGGIFFNAKEVLLLPSALLVYYAAAGLLTAEHLFYVLVGYWVLSLFAAMLGLHSGLSYDSSKAAIANSLGTMFFLFLGIFICMMLILEARSSFFLQLPSFLVFILGGSLALAASLTNKNPSSALLTSAFTLPFLTFYAITGFLLHETLGVWLVIVVAYGFTTIAMLVPAVSEFDVALGRTTLDRG